MERTKKRPHDLYRCLDTASFERAFSAETGRHLKEVVQELCGEGNACGIVLGGSLPLGLGTPTSDVDLLVLLDDPDGEVLAKASARNGVLFSGRFAESGAGVARAEIVALIKGIEVNCQILSAVAVQDVAQRIGRAQVSLTPYENGLLSRLKTGWRLYQSGLFDTRCGPLFDDDALEIRSVVWYLVGAVQDLEDARSALADSPMLVLHLGRSCAERTILAYFASQGFAYIGAKWMRAFEPQHREGRLGLHAKQFPGGRESLNILFPAFGDAAGAASYVDEVSAFVETVRSEIERKRAFQIAIALCPQLQTAK